MLQDIQASAASLLEDLIGNSVPPAVVEKARGLCDQIQVAVVAASDAAKAPAAVSKVIDLGFVKVDSTVVGLSLVDGKLMGGPAPEGQKATREILPNTFKTATVIDTQNGLTVSSRTFADGIQYDVARAEE